MYKGFTCTYRADHLKSLHKFTHQTKIDKYFLSLNIFCSEIQVQIYFYIEIFKKFSKIIIVSRVITIFRL